MKKTIFLFVIPVFLSGGLNSCTIKRFIQRHNEVNILPPTINADSVKIIMPAFSMNTISDSYKVEYTLNLPAKEKVFIEEIKRQLKLYNLDSVQEFYGVSNCVRNKMHIENFDSEVWYQPETYSCMNFYTHFYNVIFFTRMQTVEMISYSAAPMNDHSEIISLVLVFKDNVLLYSKNFRYDKPLKRKEQKAYETTNAYPFFKEDQIKHVVQKVTEDLFKRIKPK